MAATVPPDTVTRTASLRRLFRLASTVAAKIGTCSSRPWESIASVMASMASWVPWTRTWKDPPPEDPPPFGTSRFTTIAIT